MTTLCQEVVDLSSPDEDVIARSFLHRETDQFPCLSEAEWGRVRVSGFLSLADASAGPHATTGERRVSSFASGGEEEWRTERKRSAACPGGSAPGGTVRKTEHSGTETRAPFVLTEAQVVNFGSAIEAAAAEHMGGGGGAVVGGGRAPRGEEGVGGRGVEEERGKPFPFRRSKVPPLDIGLCCCCCCCCCCINICCCCELLLVVQLPLSEDLDVVAVFFPMESAGLCPLPKTTIGCS